MVREMTLYLKDELPIDMKFYILMDLLITNQVESRVESFVFLGLFYLQIISSFFSDQVGVFDPIESTSDRILNYIQKIVRLKDLFRNNYIGFKIFFLILFVVIILLLIHFFLSILGVKRSSFYSFNETFINYYIKSFIFLGYNIILDFSFTNFCFGSDEYNPNFTDKIAKCAIKTNIPLIIISIIFIILSLILNIFIQIFYCDSFYLSNSYYSKINCNYDFYWSLNNLVNSVLLVQVKYLKKEIFLIYHLIISMVLFGYYIQHYLYYDKITNLFAGLFHAVYAWSSIFFLIFAYIDFKEKAIIYILTSVIVCFFYCNYKDKIEGEILLDTPFYKIKNKYYLLTYFKNLIDKINIVEENQQDRAFLAGIIQMHSIECPNPNCLIKNSEPIYLPISMKWSDRSKKHIDDDVFLKNFIVIIMNYFMSIHDFNPDMLLNISLYYLKIIGNYCQSIYFYKKVSEMKLSLQEKFTFVRLKIQLSKAMIEKLKPSNEQCVALEHLDVSMYYKYDALSQNFVDEISKDVTLSLDFWKIFRGALRDSNKTLDFNKIFELTDKIRITKRNIEDMWNQLLKIYAGASEFFELYSEYVEQINDDDLKKRELESLKRKNDGLGDHINSNYYSVLFNKNTGIIIANGDKGSEGIIEACNGEIENIFKYKPSDIKGMNLSHLLPRLFSKDHSKYMERYFQVGEKKLIDKIDFSSFGKDKNNSIIKIKLAIKLFPILNDNVLFVGLILKENIDDIILMDSRFNIQGMSLKLMKILQIDNKLLFQNNEIPFYLICRKFVNFYNIFLQGKKKSENFGEEKPSFAEEEVKKEKEKQMKENKNKDKKNKGKKDKKDKKEKKDKNDNTQKDDLNENIEINENVELEYEIKLPQFLIDYAEKTNKNKGKIGMKLVTMATETVIDHKSEESYDDDDFDELAMLMEESKNLESQLNIIKSSAEKSSFLMQSHFANVFAEKHIENTPTPGENPSPEGATPTPGEELIEKGNVKISNKMVNFNKQSEEERNYKSKLRQYRTFFEKGKFNELEDLIDSCNKDSNSTEYKFNFTFDQYKYGNKQISYIVRCIDNKSEFGRSDEDTVGEMDPKASKYKKEKADSIKPLYGILEEEKKELLSLPEIFYKLSLDDKKFQRLLQQCKNDILNMSMAHGTKKDEIIEDENSSQSSQVGFDSGLVKKNRIEEIRSNLLLNVSNFYTLKYLKLVFVLLALCSFIFCILYIIVFWNLYDTLIDVSSVNVNLFQTTLWTTELVSIFLSLRTLFLKHTFDINFVFSNYDNTKNKTNYIYYKDMEDIIKELYYKISSAYGMLEMDIPKYLPANDLFTKYWDRISVSNVNKSELTKDDESFPMSIAQILSNSLSYISDPRYNIINETTHKLYQNLTYLEQLNIILYFNYSTFIIIENSYDNLLPNQFKKLTEIPFILSDYNKARKTSIILIILLYAGIMLLLCISYFFLIQLTNKSMTGGLEKVTKIRLEKIEETLKKIQVFNQNLKRFRDKDAKASDDNNKGNSELSDDENNQKSNEVKKVLGAATTTKKAKQNLPTLNSIVNSNGFNTDTKKYIPLSILNHSFLHLIIIFCLLCGFLIPVYIFSNQMVYNTNQLLLVQNHIFGELISSSASTVEVKCNMSVCGHSNRLEYSELVDMDKIQDVIKGITTFSQVKDFYNEKFLLNACASAIDRNKEKEKYEECLNENLIVSANSTDNLINIIEDIVENIYKEYSMKYKQEGFNSFQLFNTSYFNQMEEIFYKYIIPVGDNFAKLVKEDLDHYLTENKIMVLILVCILGVIIIIYCLIFGIIFINQLIHYLCVSRCIMKIIPTSVIIATQDLENWIENKY